MGGDGLGFLRAMAPRAPRRWRRVGSYDACDGTFGDGKHLEGLYLAPSPKTVFEVEGSLETFSQVC